ncbi:unnamed protein product [Ilex paraguariensis]|uniref:Rab-GAP TBC domain-containing protein n=1 Tax=Ilex paraguariensis TaxID=185542 RepID=A0ABC8RHC4_9AQUA
MVKKKVPDWLNSSLWSSSSPPEHPQPLTPTPPSNDASDEDKNYRIHRSAITSSTAKSKSKSIASSTVAESPVEPPVPVPPPAVVRASQSNSVGEIRDPLSSGNSNSNDHEDYGSSTAIKSSSSLAEDISRQAHFLQELSKKVINMGELRRLASQGIPDGDGIRSTVWKLLLGYLPRDRAVWALELGKKRSQYKHFKEDLLMNPSEIARRLEKSTSLENDGSNGENKGLLSRSEIPQGEHPLSLGTTSIWNQFFQDTEIMEQIDRDVKRTHPDMHFFSGDSPLANSNQDTEIMEQIDRDVKRTHPDMHFFSGDSPLANSNQEALKNILIIFAKLNPGIRYVQGMNEILAPLFYVFRNDSNEENAAFAEADTFFCFVELLSGFRDNFCQQLDNSVVGIRSTITRLSQLLKEHDEELWRHLEVTTKVNPQFYAFRWITLLLTQEFNFADSVLIWDTLLSDPEGPQVS